MNAASDPVSFKLLHASDLHIGRIEGIKGFSTSAPEVLHDVLARLRDTDFKRLLHLLPTHNGHILDEFARFVHDNGGFSGTGRDPYDAIVVTGDVAASGKRRDLRVARDFIMRRADNGFLSVRRSFWPGSKRVVQEPTLRTSRTEGEATAGTRLFVIPGNHDRYKGLGLWFGIDPPRFQLGHGPGGRRFDRYFSYAWGKQQHVRQFDPVDKKSVRLVLIGADFSLADFRDAEDSVFAVQGQGRAYPKRLDALKRATEDAIAHGKSMSRPTTVVWAIHFEPQIDARVPHWGELRLLREECLRRLADDMSIPLILCGHSHFPNDRKMFGETRVRVCGTTTQTVGKEDEPNCLFSLDIIVDPSQPMKPQVKCTPYKCDLDTMAFKPWVIAVR